MDRDVVIGSIFMGLFVLGLVLARWPHRRMPESRHFHCARCKTLTAHDNRTVKAWRRGKARFFCPACHVKWLKSRPPLPQAASYEGNAGRGCLGAVFLMAAVPVGGLAAWAYF